MYQSRGVSNTLSFCRFFFLTSLLWPCMDIVSHYFLSSVKKKVLPIVLYKYISSVLSHIPFHCRATDCLPATVDFIRHCRPTGYHNFLTITPPSGSERPAEMSNRAGQDEPGLFAWLREVFSKPGRAGCVRSLPFKHTVAALSAPSQTRYILHTLT